MVFLFFSFLLSRVELQRFISSDFNLKSHNERRKKNEEWLEDRLKQMDEHFYKERERERREKMQTDFQMDISTLCIIIQTNEFKYKFEAFMSVYANERKKEKTEQNDFILNPIQVRHQKRERTKKTQGNSTKY